MKTVIASVLLAASVVASPALARNASHHPAHQQGGAVYDGGTYLGSDPDPQVQFDWSVSSIRATGAIEATCAKLEIRAPSIAGRGRSSCEGARDCA